VPKGNPDALREGALGEAALAADGWHVRRGDRHFMDDVALGLILQERLDIGQTRPDLAVCVCHGFLWSSSLNLYREGRFV
jgi:hypothetical protein